ncbi:DUF5667 domain-containing protein [Chloroflexota bacterium]
MKRRREFDNVLEECLERLLVQGATVEQCLHDFPEHAGELKPLLETVLATKGISSIQSRPEFREQARHQFYGALREMGLKPSRSFFSWSRQPRWAMVSALAALVLVVVGSGTVAAAAGSMPDEPLYGVKLATERVRLVLTPSKLGKAELYTQLADNRVNEIIRMADEGKAEKVEQVARRLDTYLTEITNLTSPPRVAMVITAPTAGKTPAVREETTAEAPAPVVVPAPPRLSAAEERSGSREEPAREAPSVREVPSVREAPEVQEAPVRVTERTQLNADQLARLRELVKRYAAENPERLRALLQKVPASARPALLEAIRLSEEGYEKALESIDRERP